MILNGILDCVLPASFVVFCSLSLSLSLSHSSLFFFFSLSLSTPPLLLRYNLKYKKAPFKLINYLTCLCGHVYSYCVCVCVLCLSVVMHCTQIILSLHRIWCIFILGVLHTCYYCFANNTLR